MPLQFATMAVRKTTNLKKKEEITSSEIRKKRFTFSFWNGILPKANSLLSLVFYTIWIVIGLFLLLLLVQGLKQGLYSSLLNRSSQQQQQAQTPEAPAEADLPGIGKVNVQCVKEALSQESIQKILEETSSKSLQGEEKEKFDKCIVEAAAPSPTPTPTS